jgi:hypothetical protein
MGYIRIMMQLNKGTSEFVGYVMCYLILVIFTVMFTFTYLKRVLYMAFLTLIAPVVALTYPIDKIGDGQAQGFNKWLKEYIFNLLIQPMHLLLYYILVTSAFELAGTNMIYSLVALGFMIPAEKLLRSFFGFEKAQTAPALGGPTGAALTMSALNKLGSLWKGKNRQDALPGANGGNSDNNVTDSPAMLESSNPYTQFGDVAGDGIRDGAGTGGDGARPDTDGEPPKPPSIPDIDIPTGTSEGAFKAPPSGGTTGDGGAVAGGPTGSGRFGGGPTGTGGFGGGSSTGTNNGGGTSNINIGNNDRKEGFGFRLGRVISANRKAGERRYKNSVKNSHPLSKLGKTAGRIAFGGAAAVAAGSLGAAIGIANGSPGDAIKYGLGAGASGYTLGRNAVNSIPTIEDDKDAVKAHKDAYNVGPERKI